MSCTGNRNGWNCTDRPPKRSWRRAWLTATSRRPTRAMTMTDPREGAWLFNAGMRELSREESDRRAAAGEPFVIRFRVPRDTERTVTFEDQVFGLQSKMTADIEDFALLRSNGMPTYHMASCADDLDLHITHIIRGQDHLTNTFKHVLIFEALGGDCPDVCPSAAADRAGWR